MEHLFQESDNKEGEYAHHGGVRELENMTVLMGRWRDSKKSLDTG